MKLRNKKTGEVTSDYSYILLESTHHKIYHSLAELNEEWEDYKPVVPSKYYLINNETGWIITFDSKREMMAFRREFNDWREVKILLEGK